MRFPNIINPITVPRDHMSMASQKGSPNMISGALNVEEKQHLSID